MGGWAELIGVFALFLVSHAVPVRPAVRGRLVAALGMRAYLLAYSVLSLGVLVWLVIAASRAPYVPLLDGAAWQAWVPNLIMPLACALVSFGAAVPNPLSFGGAQNEAFDPDRPGVVGLTRHPLPWALALWSLAHTIANPDLAHVLLFGGFALFAIIGTRVMDRRFQRLMGSELWAQTARATGNAPLSALVSGRWRPAGLPSWRRGLLALVLWLGALALHAPVIGVSPVP